MAVSEVGKSRQNNPDTEVSAKGFGNVVVYGGSNSKLVPVPKEAAAEIKLRRGSTFRASVDLVNSEIVYTPAQSGSKVISLLRSGGGVGRFTYKITVPREFVAPLSLDGESRFRLSAAGKILLATPTKEDPLEATAFPGPEGKGLRIIIPKKFTDALSIGPGAGFNVSVLEGRTLVYKPANGPRNIHATARSIEFKLPFGRTEAQTFVTDVEIPEFGVKELKIRNHTDLEMELLGRQLKVSLKSKGSLGMSRCSLYEPKDKDGAVIHSISLTQAAIKGMGWSKARKLELSPGQKGGFQLSSAEGATSTVTIYSDTNPTVAFPRQAIEDLYVHKGETFGVYVRNGCLVYKKLKTYGNKFRKKEPRE